MSDSTPLSVHTGLDVSVDLTVASVGSRAAAYIADMLVLFLGWLLVASAAALAYPGQLPSPQVLGLVAAGWFFSQFLLFAVQEAIFDGRTYGKRLMGIRVVDAHGQPPGFVAAALRNLLRPIDNLPYGFAVGTLLVLQSASGQRLGDLAAGTRVVHDLPPSPARDALRLPADATPAEVVLFETWARRSRTLAPQPLQDISARLVAWTDDRFPGFLPPAPTALDRLSAGLAPAP